MMSRFTSKDDAVKATIIWCLTTVYHHAPVTSSVGFLQGARLAFPDSSLLRTLELERTKISYTIVHGLAPHIREKLDRRIEACCEFSIFFDEAFNTISTTKQLDIIVRFWDDVEGKACSRYLSSSFLRHSKATDVLSGIQDALIKFDLKKLMQISMDAPNVNKKVLKDLQTYLSQIEPNFPKLLDIGTCGLHTLNNAFQTSVKESNCKWDLVLFLRVCYYTFHKSAARRVDYVQLNNSEDFPDKYCEIRWLNNRPAAEKILKIQTHLKEFVEFYKDQKKGKTVANFGFMYDCLRDPLLEAKLKFFISICIEPEPFLTLYQTENPMVPFLYDDLKFVIIKLMRKFVKPKVVSSVPLIKIDVENVEHTMDVKDIDLGYATRIAVKSSKASAKEILIFKNDCLRTLKLLVKKLIEKSPVNNRLLKSLIFCNPAVINPSRDSSISRLKSCLEFFVDKGRISGEQADIADNEFQLLISNTVVLDRCKHFDKKKDRLDTFWLELVKSKGSDDQHHLFSVLRKIFVMFHGNADVERGFSINKHCLIVNQSSKSLIAQRLVYDAVQRAGWVSEFKIDKGVINAAIGARKNDQMYLDLEARKNKKAVEDYQKRRRKAEVLSVLDEKRQRLEKQRTEVYLEIDLVKNF